LRKVQSKHIHKSETAKGTLEEQVKTLQKHMEAILATVRALKATAYFLDKRTALEENQVINEILEAQKVINEVIVENLEAIKVIDRELKQIMDIKCDTKTSNGSDRDEEEPKDTVIKIQRRKCIYFDRGFCKFNKKMIHWTRFYRYPRFFPLHD
jgi:outer membrane protein assembly factor BamA